MTLYRNTSTSKVWTEEELTSSLFDEVEGLDDEDSFKQEVEVRGGEAIRDYIIECCLVGIYSQLDGDETEYRRPADGRTFYIDELEHVFDEEVSGLGPEQRERVTFSAWLGGKVRDGALEEFA